jgi:hypothetical protein
MSVFLLAPLTMVVFATTYCSLPWGFSGYTLINSASTAPLKPLLASQHMVEQNSWRQNGPVSGYHNFTK